MPPPSRIVYPPKPQQKKPLPRRTLFTLLAILLAAFLGGSFVYLIRMDSLRIDQLELHGLSLLPATAIESELRKAIGGTTWGFLPRDHFLLVSNEAIEHRLRDKFPQIRKIDVSKRFPDRLIAKIEERMLWGVYCLREKRESAPHSCFYLDTTGTAYDALAYFEGFLLPVVYGVLPATLGTEALPKTTLEFFDSAKQALQPLQANLLSLALSSSTPQDVRLNLAEGWYLWVTPSRPITEWLDILNTVLEKEIGSKRAELEYIDLRFGNKVFYKFR